MQNLTTLALLYIAATHRLPCSVPRTKRELSCSSWQPDALFADSTLDAAATHLVLVLVPKLWIGWKINTTQADPVKACWLDLSFADKRTHFHHRVIFLEVVASDDLMRLTRCRVVLESLLVARRRPLVEALVAKCCQAVTETLAELLLLFAGIVEVWR